MISRFIALQLVLATALTLVAVQPAHATKIDPFLLEELVLSADIVALVECETAGGLTARFKVVESFKGPKVGATVVLYWPADYWGEQFPIALCGERYFVTAYKAPPSNLISTTSGAPVPLWWRRIPADFRFPLMQGKQLLTPDDMKEAFPKLRRTVQALLAMNGAEQEAALLRALIDDNLLGRGGKDAKSDSLKKKFDGMKTAEELVTELIRLAHEEPKKWRHSTFRVVDKGGMAKTLAVLEKLPKDKLPWTEAQRGSIFDAIQSRLAKRNAGDRTDSLPKDDAPPSAESLNMWRKALSNRESEEWEQAFVGLMRHDPAALVEMLLKWDSTKTEHRRERDMNHSLASHFAAECGKDREKNLSALLDAKDAWVRVAAAVYLCFENEDKGVAALKKLTTLQGIPGGWAALTLARRGHKDAVPRALELFPKKWTEEDEAENFSSVQQTLQNHLLVLLSNSAYAGKAPQYRVMKDTLPTSESLQAWWHKHRENVVLRDPWMEVLTKQKID
jgi:hypothetical protein